MMAVHARAVLRNTLKVRLEGTPTAVAAVDGPSSVVFDSVELAKSADILPCFVYWINTETIESLAKGIPANVGEPPQVKFLATSSCLLFGLAEDVPTMDTLCAEIEIAMSQTFVGMTTRIQDTLFNEDAAGEKQLFGARLTYEIRWSYDSNDPTTPDQALG